MHYAFQRMSDYTKLRICCLSSMQVIKKRRRGEEQTLILNENHTPSYHPFITLSWRREHPKVIKKFKMGKMGIL